MGLPLFAVKLTPEKLMLEKFPVRFRAPERSVPVLDIEELIRVNDAF